jgi:hypothetical protein
MMPAVSILIVRIVAGLHLGMAAVGAFWVSMMALWQLSDPVKIDGYETPHIAQFFWAYVTMNVIFLTGLALSSWHLWRLRRYGLLLLLTVLSAEAVYWALMGVLMSVLSNTRFAPSAAGAAGIGNMGLAVQLFIGYPLTGLLGAGVLQLLGVWRRALATA